MMPAMPDTTDEFTVEERAEAEESIRQTLEQMGADPNRRPTYSPLDVPVEVLVDAELQVRKVDRELRAERVAQGLVDWVAAGGELPARRLTPDEVRAIVGPPYDDER